MAASQSVSSVRQSLLSLSSKWPVDKLRPTLQFKDSLQAATNRVFPATTAETTPQGPSNETRLSKAQEMMQSLERLLADDARKTYPMTKKTLQPASFPKHYLRMQDGIARAERGEIVKGKTWKEWFSWQ